MRTLPLARREDQRERIGGFRLVQHFGGHEPAAQALPQAEQPPQPRVFVAQLGDEPRGERCGVALRHDLIVAGARGAELFGLLL